MSESRSGLSGIEVDILRSFGWTALELESALYERYLMISIKRSLTTLEGFRAYLREMEAKGYISQETLHGERAYRKLLVGWKLDEKTHPKTPLDEMRLAIGSYKAKRQRTQKDLSQSEEHSL